MHNQIAYNAILNAAAHIEQNPDLLNWWESDVPPRVWMDGCPLGWIGFFANQMSELHLSNHAEAALVVLGVNNVYFYNEMDRIQGVGPHGVENWRENWRLAICRYPLAQESWVTNATICAGCLRKYAERFAPTLPERVRAIFGEARETETA